MHRPHETTPLLDFWRRHRIWLLVGLLLLAAVWRAVYFVEMQRTPYGNDLMMDAQYHDQWARDLAAGHWIGNEVFFRAPLYPYLMGVIYAVTGNSQQAVKILQMVLGCLSCLLVYLLAQEFFAYEVALVGCLLSGLYGMFIYFENELLIVSLIVFLDLAALILLARALKRRQSRLFFLSGLLFGLSAIARPNILLFVVTIPVVSFLVLRPAVSKRLILNKMLVGALGVALPIAPVLVYNAAAGGDFVPIASQGGVNFYIGNNAYADGHTAVVPGTRPTWWGGYEDQIRLAKEALGKPDARPSQISAYWYRQGLKFLLQQPLQAAGLYAKKLFMFWNGYEIGNNRDINFVTQRSILFSYFTVRFWMICPLALVGFYLAARKRLGITLLVFFVGTYMVSVVIFFINARYRMPIIPVLIILAAYTICELAGWIKRRRRRPDKPVPAPREKRAAARAMDRRRPGRLAGASGGGDRPLPRSAKTADARTISLPFLGAILILSAVMVYPRPRGNDLAEAYFHEALAYQRAEDYQQARNALRQALAENPRSVQALVNLGMLCLVNLQDYEQAAGYFQRALDLAPADTKALYNLAITYDLMNDARSAEKYFRQYFATVAARPVREEDRKFLVNAHHKLGAILENRGDDQDALGEYREGLQRDPAAYQLWADVGRVDLKLRKFPEAEEALDKALGLQPDFTYARQLMEDLHRAQGTER